jgi:hypothetical protein
LRGGGGGSSGGGGGSEVTLTIESENMHEYFRDEGYMYLIIGEFSIASISTIKTHLNFDAFLLTN